MFTPILNYVGELTRQSNWAAPVLVLGGVIGMGVIAYIYIRVKIGKQR